MIYLILEPEWKQRVRMKSWGWIPDSPFLCSLLLLLKFCTLHSLFRSFFSLHYLPILTNLCDKRGCIYVCSFVFVTKRLQVLAFFMRKITIVSGDFSQKSRRNPSFLYRNNNFLYIFKAFRFLCITCTQYCVQIIYTDYQWFTSALKSLYIQENPIM